MSPTSQDKGSGALPAAGSQEEDLLDEDEERSGIALVGSIDINAPGMSLDDDRGSLSSEEGSNDSTPRIDDEDDESLNIGQEVIFDDNCEPNSIKNNSMAASSLSEYQQQVLHSEEVDDDLHVEESPVKNMMAVGHIGSFFGSYNAASRTE